MNRESVAENAAPDVFVQHDHTVVAVHGELDIATCPELRDRLAEVLEEHAIPLIVDLSGVTFCDAAGLAVLVGTQARARRAGTSMYITGVRPQVEKVLRATELDRILHAPPEEFWP